MPRVGSGKQSFRIIYFFLCHECKESLGIDAAVREGLIEPSDKWAKKLALIPPKQKTKAKIVSDITPNLCGPCRTQTLNIFDQLGVIGKPVTVPNFKGLFRLKTLSECLYAAVAAKGGVPKQIIFATLQNVLNENALSDSHANVWQALVTRHPQLGDLTTLNLDSQDLEEKYAFFLMARSAIPWAKPFTAKEYLSNKGWERIKKQISPYGYRFKETKFT